MQKNVFFGDKSMFLFQFYAYTACLFTFLDPIFTNRIECT